MEAYVSSFVFCDTIHTQITPDGPQYQIVRPLHMLSPVAIPGNFSFAISCNIAGFEKDKEHSLTIILYSPDGTECIRPVSDVKFTFDSKVIGNEAAKTPGLSLNVDLRNVVLRSSGLYKAIVYMDERPIGEYPIEVVKAE